MMNIFLFMMHSELVLLAWKSITAKQMIPLPTLFHMVRICFFNLTFIISDIIIVLDPTRKLEYLNAAWEEEYIESGMDKMKKIVSASNDIYIYIS